MRKRSLALVVPFILAACASSAGSPSASAPPSVAAPSEAASSPSASAAASPSAAPSEAAASANPWTAYVSDSLQPRLDEITAASTLWGERFATAAAAGATDSDKIALGNAAFRLRTALLSATSTVTEDPPPECGTEATGQVTSFVDKLTTDAADLLATTDATADNLADAQALVQETADRMTPVNEAIAQACA
jgi:hypothetical protein